MGFEFFYAGGLADGQTGGLEVNSRFWNLAKAPKNIQVGTRNVMPLIVHVNTFLLLKRHLSSGTQLILVGWKIVPNEEHVQCDHRFASQPLANEPLHSSQLFETSLQKARGTTSLCGP